MEQEPKINDIPNRQYMLSPAVQYGNDRECTNKDFCQADAEYIDLGKLGFGARVFHRITNINYVIINIEKKKVTKASVQQKINKTIDLMYKANSPYLLRVLNHYEDEENVYFILEDYDGETLETKILKKEMNNQNALKDLKEIVKGILCLHENKMFNVTVTPETILIGECVKLTDYGIKLGSKNTNKKSPRPTFTLKVGESSYPITSYTSPEELAAMKAKGKAQTTEKTDSWNCGILLYEILTEFNSPFRTESIEEFTEDILNCNINLSLIEDDFCREIISNFLKKDPQERMTIEEFLDNEKIIEIDIEEPEIDFNDNIINSKPIPQTMNQGNYDYDDAMENLQFENENLKKRIQKLEFKMNSNVFDLEDQKKSILTEQDLENKEKKLDLLLEQMGHNNLSSLGDEDLFELNEDDESKSQNKLKKIKTKYLLLKEELKEEKEKNKKLEEEILKLKEEKTIIEDENKVSEEEMSKENIEQVTKKVDETVLTFTQTLNSFKEIVEKLIRMSKENNESLSKESKNYIEEKENILFELTAKLKENKELNEDGDLVTDITKISSLELVKEKYKEVVQQLSEYQKKESLEETLKNEIKILKEKENVNKELYNTIKLKNNELLEVLAETKVENANLENIIGDVKYFITVNCNEAQKEEFFEELGKKYGK